MSRVRRDGLVSVVVVFLAGLSLVTFYLSTYPVHGFRVPLGWDSAGYSWRTEMARANGVANLPSHIPPPGPVNPGRPGFVVVGGLLSSVLRVHSLRVAEVLPGLMAAAAALAAGVAVWVVRRSRWQGLAMALGVGTSMFMVRAINVEGYQDNVIGLALFTAALTPIVLATRDRRAVVPAALLIGATGLAHWNVLEVALGVLGITALAFLPIAVRAVRAEHRRVTDTAAARLVAVAAVGAGLAVAGIMGVLTAPLPSPRIDVGQFIQKVRRDLPAYHLPVTLSASAVGALALAGYSSGRGEEDARSRAFLVLMVAWCQVTVLAFVGEWALGRGIPGHRVLAICLAIPILAVLGLIWLGERVGRRWRAVGASVVVAGLGLSAFLAQAEWSSYRPVMNPDQLSQGATAASYLDAAHVGSSQPIVFVVDNRDANAWSDVWLTAHTLRAVLPAARIERMYVFVGAPEDYLAERPTRLSSPDQGSGISVSQYDGISSLYFAALLPTYSQQPVALILSSTSPEFFRWTNAHVGSVVGPGVAVVRGPPLARAVPAAPNPVPSAGWPEVFLLALAGLALLTVSGGGWAVMLVGRWVGPIGEAGLAPAVGAGALLAGGIILDVLGLALAGREAYLVVVLVAASGWAAAFIRRRAAAS